MRFQLCDEDRKLFDAPEWMDLELLSISVADLEELSERFGFDPADWPHPFVGQLTLEQAGDPDAKPKPPPWRNRALAWMLLRQNGIPASWQDAGQVRLFKLREDKASPAESPGKEATPDRPSGSSAASTTRRSSTSTASRKRKST